MSTKKIKAPKGTRDLYPEDLLRQQYITNAWRDAAIRCGFDEIAGPTFETTELYAVKSGEGILSELFQAFSGKSPKEVERVKETGQAEFALRPEFTPTLARMYAARAKELPQPCKWFTAGPYFRAERPQRGRLREFLQWNVDVLGSANDGPSHSDGDCLECCVSAFEVLGLSPSDVQIHLNSRSLILEMFNAIGIASEQHESTFDLLDKLGKIPTTNFVERGHEIGLADRVISLMLRLNNGRVSLADCSGIEVVATDDPFDTELKGDVVIKHLFEFEDSVAGDFYYTVRERRIGSWCTFDPSIVRGLAYYTGTVFEAIAEGERAVAGGGRYDNLIELFGGPPTPACGFGMGDVVLGNLLDDKGLMPTGSELMDAVARPQASIRPVAFVVPNGDEENEPLVHTLVANLRRGIECNEWSSRDDRKPWDADRYRVAPMHARVSYKSTRNLKKLRADAVNQHARYFVEIHADNKVELTDLDNRESITSDTHGSFSVDPSAENYVGTAIASRI